MTAIKKNPTAMPSIYHNIVLFLLFILSDSKPPSGLAKRFTNANDAAITPAKVAVMM